MKPTWKITYEIPPMRGLYHENVAANTQEGAIEFLESIINHRIRVVKVEEIQ
ncbi:hypothetical protein ACH0BF_20330 [Pseudobacillus sp. 179-B 2D1 NHS]|uniref:hypothetical protein n=1 Tax=Pseudobacillus sp. 179-B 2D1 NHS TaxID=3374292 RepID=UPI00387A012E